MLDSHCPWNQKRVKNKVQAPLITEYVIKKLQIIDYSLEVARQTDRADDCIIIIQHETNPP